MTRLRSAFLPLLAIAVLALAAGCPTDESRAGGKPFVVCTTGMIGDAASRVAGEHAEVISLMGPGVDPHLYRASEGDLRRLTRADLVLYNGLDLEGKMDDVLGRMARSRPVVAVAEVVPEEARLFPAAYEGNPDPHVWFDVRLWSRVIDPVAEALAEVDPAHADAFRAHADAFREELEELDAWVEEQIERIPEERRVLVTAHDAFGYFGDRYGIEVAGLQGLSTASEAGIQDVERLADMIADRGIPAIFVESSVPRRSIEAVQSAVEGRDHEVSIGGELFSDAMGAAGTPEGTYPGMVRHNVETIVGALR